MLINNIIMSNLSLPDEKTLNTCFKLSLKIQKPIDTYFYIDSMNNGVCVKTINGETIIYKDENEHTTTVSNIYATDTCYLVVTENTIHILSKEVRFENLDE